jgi:hypothetical protein
VMIALAIDRNLAQRVTYPYVWGAVVLTLIWPVVFTLISVIAYMGGNVAMALGNEPVHTFDQRTLEIIKVSGSDPFFTALLGAAIMLIASITLWMSPYIAYQLSTGSMYEVASSTASTLGGGIQYYATSLAGSILQNAVMPSTGGANGIPRPPRPLNPYFMPRAWRRLPAGRQPPGEQGIGPYPPNPAAPQELTGPRY